MPVAQTVITLEMRQTNCFENAEENRIILARKIQRYSKADGILSWIDHER